jgi:glycine/D-amino acid oxidase-like deaminating enzyme
VTRSASPVGWDADPAVQAAVGYPALDSAITADLCVVGLGGSALGAIGAALERGLSVVGLDAGPVAAGAAGRNGGILSGGPAIGAADGARRWGLTALTDLYRQTSAEIDHLAAILGPEEIRHTEVLRLVEPRWDAEDRPAAEWGRERDQAAAERRVLEAIGIVVRDYHGPWGIGWSTAGDAAMSPPRRALGLAAHYAARYPRSLRMFEHSPVLGVGNGVARTPGGSVSAGLVLVATDGGLAALLPSLAGRIRPVRLQMLATAPVSAGLLPGPVSLRFGYDYAQQDGAGRLLIGGGRDRDADAEETSSTEPTPVVQRWIERQATRLAGGPVTVTHRWAATAGYTPDGVPLVVRTDDRTVACGGYNGHGNLIGPLAARAALELGLDGTPPPVWFTGPD